MLDAMDGRLDILINNAGYNLRKKVQEYDLDEVRSILDTKPDQRL